MIFMCVDIQLCLGVNKMFVNIFVGGCLPLPMNFLLKMTNEMKNKYVCFKNLSVFSVDLQQALCPKEFCIFFK